MQCVPNWVMPPCHQPTPQQGSHHRSSASRSSRMPRALIPRHPMGFRAVGTLLCSHFSGELNAAIPTAHVVDLHERAPGLEGDRGLSLGRKRPDGLSDGRMPEARRSRVFRRRGMNAPPARNAGHLHTEETADFCAIKRSFAKPSACRLHIMFRPCEITRKSCARTRPWS